MLTDSFVCSFIPFSNFTEQNVKCLLCAWLLSYTMITDGETRNLVNWTDNWEHAAIWKTNLKALLFEIQSLLIYFDSQRSPLLPDLCFICDGHTSSHYHWVMSFPLSFTVIWPTLWYKMLKDSFHRIKHCQCLSLHFQFISFDART